MAATRKVNVRFLGLLVGAVVVLIPSVHYVHAYQLRRHADALKHRADQAFDAKRFDEAARYYYLFLIQQPDDIKARIGWGEALDKKTNRTAQDLLQVFMNFEHVIRQEPEPGRHDEIRRRLAEVAMMLGRYNEAMEHLEVLKERLELLLKGDPEHNDQSEQWRENNGELKQLLASCHAAKGENDEAVKLYKEAIEDAPRHILSYAELGSIYLRRLQMPEKANEVREELIANNNNNAKAHLVAAGMLQQQNLSSDSEIDQALKLAPKDPDAILAAARAAHRQHKLDQARAYLEKGIDLHKRNAEMYHLLARVETETRQLDKAEACLRLGLTEVPEEGHNDLLHMLALVLVQRGEIAKAEKEVENLQNHRASEILVNEVKARIHMHKGEWLAASRLLEDMRPLLAQRPDRAYQVELLLGHCYDRQRQFDRAQEKFEQALRLNPESLAARKGKAQALTALGKSEEALLELRRVLPKDPTVAASMAHLLTLRNLRLQPEKRDWKEVDQALGQALRMAPNSIDVALLQAEVLRVKDQPDAALTLLRKTRDKAPTEPGPWLAMIRMAENQGQPEKSLPIIEEAEKKLGDRADLRLARARYWLRSGVEAAPAALAKLEQDTGKLAPAEAAALLAGLADLYIRTGNIKEAKRLWAQLAALHPTDLQIRLALFELAFLDGKEEELDQLLGAIRRIEGEDGTLWRYCQVCRIISAARKGKADQQKLAEAKALLNSVSVQRPRWGRVALREAELTDLEGNLQAALDLYQRALNLGEHDPNSFGRPIGLLYQKGRFGEARSMIAKLEEQNGFLPEGLKRLKISLLSQLGDRTGAVNEAEKPVKAGSKDPRDHLWYAQALALDGKKKEAEDAYRAAAQLPDSDKVPELWMQFVLFLVQTDQKAKAEGVIREAEKRLPREIAPFVLARCYETTNQPGKVEELYLNALKKNPIDVAILRSLVNFYERAGQLAKAEPFLRKLLEPQTKAGQEDLHMARNALAALLANTGDYQRFQEGLALLNENSKDGKESVADVRARALIYAKRSYYWRQAIELLEQLQEHEGQTLDEQLTLASLYERFGASEWEKARTIYRNVLATHADAPAILYLCARSLLRHNEKDMVPNWLLAKLQKLDGPQSLRALEIQVRLLKAQGALDEAAKFLKDYAERPDANLETAASLLEEIGKTRAAEDLYRRLVDKSGRPESALVLAGFLGRLGRPADNQEALELSEKAWKTCPPELVAYVGITVLNGMKSPPPTEQECQRIGRGLEEALQKAPQSLSLIFYLAALRSIQQKYDDAEKFYRQIIDQDHRNAIARNNLAWLLAVRSSKTKAAEALELIKRAIELVGPSPELLDTRALCYLQMGSAEEALKDLTEALKEESVKENPSAVIYFHHALAREMLKDPDAAVSLKKAQSLKLKVHPLEQESYDRLLKALGMTMAGGGQPNG